MNEGKRTRRVALLKKLIITFLILGILIPIILCVILFYRVNRLSRQVEALTALQNEQKAQEDSRQADITEIIETTALDQELPQTDYAGTLDGQSVEDAASDVSQEESQDAAGETAEQKSGTKVYLTFDDGPSTNTEAILDILKEYGVKATFFVTGKEQDYYKPIYQRIVEEGHTLGMHSYSHKYKEIYASKEAFTEDLERLQNFLYETTGVWSRFYRFPGGSANEVSSVDMNTLAEYLTEENIYYLDWNVSCQDATGKKKKPQELADNVIDNITYYNTAVVLLHDGADKTSTVEALPIILTQLRQMENVSILPVSDEMNLIQQLKEHRETED